MPLARLSTTRRTLAVGTVLAVLCAAIAAASSFAQTMGHTTAEGTVVPGPPLDPAKPEFLTLTPGGPGAVRVLRELPLAKAQSRRQGRRRSLAYFAQLTDFQLADEESPARQELNAPLVRGSSSWRPQEALTPAVIDYSLRQLNHFTTASPDRGAKGRRAAMDFAILTGDQSDNQQENEMTWVRQLIEGGQTIDPNSGTSDYSDCSLFDKVALSGLPNDEARRYTGVQDYSDYNGGAGDPNFYDPNRLAGPVFTSWPGYEGLMDRAQRPFTPMGLHRGPTRVPTYVANGNHDGLVQGNATAVVNSERVATGCFKPFATNPPRALNASSTFSLPTGFSVPPDARRRFVDRVEAKRIYGAGSQADAHGFDFVDPSQNAASGFSAGYYAWDPKPGLRFISLETVSEGGATVGSPQGNIDDSQFGWLRRELAQARSARKIVVVFGHHAIRTMTSPTPDEAAPTCSGRYASVEGPYSGTQDSHGHDRNPGCDLDPRGSSPIHLGGELASLLSASGNVVAYLAGHSHANRVAPCSSACGARGNWWEINTTATNDWPQQHRLLEIMDNRDGTLSLLGTPVDHGAQVGLPPPGSAAGFDENQLASLARAFAFNDPKQTKAAGGRQRDANVELIVRDPRAGRGAGLCAMPTRRVGGKRVDRARLGGLRRTNRRVYPPRSLNLKTSQLDRFCLGGGGYARVGYPTAAIREDLSRRERRLIRGRAVLALTSSASHRLEGIRRGSRVATVRRRLRGESRYRVNGNDWYLTATTGSRIVVRVRRGRVVELGLADLRLTAGKKRIARFLRSFS